jgi:hypothetical protein
MQLMLMIWLQLQLCSVDVVIKELSADLSWICSIEATDGLALASSLPDAGRVMGDLADNPTMHPLLSKL